MTRSVLFFGDSNTRGFGVGRALRFATLAEDALAPALANRWTFHVSSCSSELGLIRERLAHALRKYAPDLLVFHCPGGPLVPLIDYPTWVRIPQVVFRRLQHAMETRLIRDDQHRRDTPAAQRDALYEGLYVDAAHRWKPSVLPGLHEVHRRLVRRFPTKRVITRDRYLQRLQELADLIRTLHHGPIIFLGLLPLREDYYPGYNRRVLDWNPAISDLVQHPERQQHYVDVQPLFSLPHQSLLIRDGTHLSAAGHQRIAELLIPVLRRVIVG